MNQIITLTLAPAVDVEYHSAGSQPGLNRTYSHTVTAGGKGINVSRAILRLSDENETPLPLKTVFPCAGETGTLLRNLLENEGMDTNGAVETSGSTRVNTSLIPDHGREIEINAPGAPLTEDELAEIEERVLDNLLPGDVVCICGSVPAGVEKSYPAHLAKKVRRRGGIAVLDCDGEALIEAAKMDEDDAAGSDKAELSGAKRTSLIPKTGVCVLCEGRSAFRKRASCGVQGVAVRLRDNDDGGRRLDVLLRRRGLHAGYYFRESSKAEGRGRHVPRGVCVLPLHSGGQRAGRYG